MCSESLDYRHGHLDRRPSNAIVVKSSRPRLDERDNRTHALFSVGLNGRTELEWLRERVRNTEQRVHGAQAFPCIHEMRYFRLAHRPVTINY